MEMRDVMWWLIELIEYWNWRIVEEPVDRDGSVDSLEDSVHCVVDYRYHTVSGSAHVTGWLAGQQRFLLGGVCWVPAVECRLFTIHACGKTRGSEQWDGRFVRQARKRRQQRRQRGPAIHLREQNTVHSGGLAPLRPPDVNKNGGAERQPGFGVIYSSGRLTGCEAGPLSARDTFWQRKQATEAGLRNVQDRSRAFHKPQKKERDIITHSRITQY